MFVYKWEGDGSGGGGRRVASPFIIQEQQQ